MSLNFSAISASSFKSYSREEEARKHFSPKNINKIIKANLQKKAIE